MTVDRRLSGAGFLFAGLTSTAAGVTFVGKEDHETMKTLNGIGRHARREERFQLAAGGTLACVAVCVAALTALFGATIPLWAAIALGALGAWVGEVFGQHLATSVPAWRMFGLAATVGAAIGWIAAAALESRPIWDTGNWPQVIAVAAVAAALAVACRPPRS